MKRKGKEIKEEDIECFYFQENYWHDRKLERMTRQAVFEGKTKFWRLMAVLLGICFKCLIEGEPWKLNVIKIFV